MIYLNFVNNKPAFYDSDINIVPRTAKVISVELWQDYLINQNTKEFNRDCTELVEKPLTSEQNKQQTNEANVSQLLGIYKTFPLGYQVAFEPAKNAVIKYMLEDNYTYALEVIQTYPLVLELEPERQIFIDALQSLND